MNIIESRLREQLPYWEQLDETDRRALVESGKMVHYKAGENVRGYSNDPGIMLIQSGMLQSYLLSEDGKIVVVYWPKADDICIFSTLQIVNNVAFELYIDAHEDSDVLIVPIEVFVRITKKNIYAENFLNTKATQCLSKIIIAMEKILFTSIDKRLAEYLANKATEKGTNELHVTHEQIAGTIGSVREVVTRALNRMANKGNVELFRGGVRILNMEDCQPVLEK